MTLHSKHLSLAFSIEGSASVQQQYSSSDIYNHNIKALLDLQEMTSFYGAWSLSVLRYIWQRINDLMYLLRAVVDQ